MEPLDEYMDKIMNLIKAVRSKDELVTEGIQKLAFCEKEIIKMRLERQTEQRELREELMSEGEAVKSLEFEVEQLNEQYMRLSSQKERDDKVLEQISSEISKKMENVVSAWKTKNEELTRKRKILEDKININLVDSKSNSYE